MSACRFPRWLTTVEAASEFSDAFVAGAAGGAEGGGGQPRAAARTLPEGSAARQRLAADASV